MMQITLFLFFVFANTVAFAATPDYQKAVQMRFPGFSILSKSDFAAETQQADTPGLVVGYFNEDRMKDFAALIRTKDEKHGASHDYFEGKFVVCLGLPKGGYKCQTIRSLEMILPYETYLSLAPPQRIGCMNDKEGKDFINVKTDSFVENIAEKASIQYIHEKNDSYHQCLTGD